MRNKKIIFLLRTRKGVAQNHTVGLDKHTVCSERKTKAKYAFQNA